MNEKRLRLVSVFEKNNISQNFIYSWWKYREMIKKCLSFKIYQWKIDL